MNSCYRRWLWL